jgi:ankyrin repeat protein
MRFYDKAIRGLLRRKVNVNAKEDEGKIVLHFAAGSGSEEFSHLFLEMEPRLKHALVMGPSHCTLPLRRVVMAC